jgi:hypothetical protein
MYLFYSQHLSSATFRPHTVHLLPVNQAWLTTLATEAWPTRVLPTFTMDWDRLFSALMRQYLFVSLYRPCAESLASENASRLAAMQGAEKNIDDRLTELQALFRRQRQMAITAELLDIVAGFEAVIRPETYADPSCALPSLPIASRIGGHSTWASGAPQNRVQKSVCHLFHGPISIAHSSGS